jgi:hypothetical protein
VLPFTRREDPIQIRLMIANEPRDALDGGHVHASSADHAAEVAFSLCST